MEFVTVLDEYEQRWKIYEDEPLYKEAKEANKSGAEVIWPLLKIAQNRGWGWWTVFKDLEEFERDLEAQLPNPSKSRLIDTEREYSPKELNDAMQIFGGYLSILYHLEGKCEAQCHALKEGFKNGMIVAMARSPSASSTLTAKEGEILSENQLFSDTKKLQIKHESTLMLIQGWRKSYEQAFATISRIVTLRGSEAQFQTTRYP